MFSNPGVFQETFFKYKIKFIEIYKMNHVNAIKILDNISKTKNYS